MEKIDIKRRIVYLKGCLCSTDYMAIKYAEGQLSAEEYKSVKEQRQDWRDEINSLETELKTKGE